MLKLGVKHATMNDIDPDVLKLSEHPDIDVRGKVYYRIPQFMVEHDIAMDYFAVSATANSRNVSEAFFQS